MNMLNEHPALWVPLLGLMFSIVEMLYWAVRGQAHYSPLLAIFSLAWIWPYIWALDELNISGWRLFVLASFLVAGACMNIYRVFAGHKWEKWGVGQTVFTIVLSIAMFYFLWVQGVS